MDSLRALARTLHPEISDDRSNSFAIVGLVFDASCKLVHHAYGRRKGSGGVTELMTPLFPDSIRIPRAPGGIADFRTRTGDEIAREKASTDRYPDGGTPWVVWAVLPAAKR